MNKWTLIFFSPISLGWALENQLNPGSLDSAHWELQWQHLAWLEEAVTVGSFNKFEKVQLTAAIKWSMLES